LIQFNLLNKRVHQSQVDGHVIHILLFKFNMKSLDH